MIKVYSNMSLNNLKEMLKQEVKEITLQDLFKLSEHFREETQYLPEEYKKEYAESVQNVVVTRFTALKNDTKNYKGYLSQEDVENIEELVKTKDKIVEHILSIITVYTIYLLQEPIHNIGTTFPGKLNVYKKGKYYYCPVKKYHIVNNKSLCKYCIAKIIED